MELIAYLDRLLKIFDKLENEIAYLKVDNVHREVKYIQQTKTGTNIVRLGTIFYDFIKGGFIKYSTILHNKEVLSKLQNYKEELITLKKYEYGFEVRVYNISGELIYHQYIRFFDKTRWYQRLYLARKFPELMLVD